MSSLGEAHHHFLQHSLPAPPFISSKVTDKVRVKIGVKVRVILGLELGYCV